MDFWESSLRACASRRGNLYVIARPRSFLSRHCEGHGSGPWQSRFCVSQYTFGTRDCHVGTKGVPPRNDVGRRRVFGIGDCFVVPSVLLAMRIGRRETSLRYLYFSTHSSPNSRSLSSLGIPVSSSHPLAL